MATTRKAKVLKSLRRMVAYDEKRGRAPMISTTRLARAPSLRSVPRDSLRRILGELSREQKINHLRPGSWTRKIREDIAEPGKPEKGPTPWDRLMLELLKRSYVRILALRPPVRRFGIDWILGSPDVEEIMRRVQKQGYYASEIDILKEDGETEAEDVKSAGWIFRPRSRQIVRD